MQVWIKFLNVSTQQKKKKVKLVIGLVEQFVFYHLAVQVHQLHWCMCVCVCVCVCWGKTLEQLVFIFVHEFLVNTQRTCLTKSRTLVCCSPSLPTQKYYWDLNEHIWEKIFFLTMRTSGVQCHRKKKRTSTSDICTKHSMEPGIDFFACLNVPPQAPVNKRNVAIFVFWVCSSRPTPGPSIISLGIIVISPGIYH